MIDQGDNVTLTPVLLPRAPFPKRRPGERREMPRRVWTIQMPNGGLLTDQTRNGVIKKARKS